MSSIASTTRRRPRRRGISSLWLVVTIPIALLLVSAVVHFGNVWLARVELENALEAAALAAVKEWGEAGGGSTLVPRNVGVSYAAANTVRCDGVETATNFDWAPGPDNPNQNLTCSVGCADPSTGSPPSGNFIFGAIVDTDPLRPVTFNAGIAGGCTPGQVFIDVEKEDGGADVDARAFGIFFDDGPPNLSIRSVAITLPVLNPHAYWDAGKPPVVSNTYSVADDLNRGNTVFPNDVRGLDPDPTIPGPPPSWGCPNGNGDVCFSFSDLITGTRYRTLTIHFADGTFTTTQDPNTTDFLRFGASFNRLKPTPPAGDNNDGDAFGRLGVPVLVTFYNTITGQTSTASGVFVDVDKDGDGDFDDGRSEANVSGAGGGKPAVRAQATIPVRTCFGKLFGCGDYYYVSACTTAVYDCGTGRSRLIRVDRFICPGP